VQNRRQTRQWWGALPVAILFMLALAPQIASRFGHRPSSGSYFSFNSDEAPYLAYVNALKQGRPRKSDPFSGRDDRAGAAQPESIFSIQFMPAYAVAWAARVAAVSSQTAFSILSCLVAICAALGIYVLIRSVSGDAHHAAAGALIVLCCGSLRFAPFVTRFSSVGRAQYFPFLRGYLPSFAFPFFILFLIIVWLCVTTKRSRKQLVTSFAAAAIFILLLFSYFYLWTAVIAWLCILAGLWLVLRPDSYQQQLRSIAIVAGVAVAGLFGYWQLLTHRATSTDAFQVVTRTHRPDLFRLPELIGLAAAAAILFFARRRAFGLREPGTLFIISLALLPLAVFNQQVLTGYSIQPIHYELYVTNYTALLAVVLGASTLAQAHRTARFRKWFFALAAVVAIVWGVVEMAYAIRARTELNAIRDEARPAALRLADLAKTGGDDPRNSIVFATNIVQADTLPADAPQPLLWAPHMRSFPGVDFAEDKSRYYAQLYYGGVDAAAFESLLRETTIAPSAVFGWERVNSRLASEPNPISEDEIQKEIRRYTDYVTTFDQVRAASVPLAFAVTSRKDNLTNLDRWYVRDEGETVGNLMLYRVRLR
jgi:hypothetical protein